MKTISRSFLTIVLLSAACLPLKGQTYSGPDEDVNEILAANKRFSEFYMNGDYESLAASYCNDGVILPPQTDIIKGRNAILKRWVLPEGVRVSYHRIIPSEIHVEGAIAYDIGYYEGRTIRKDGTEVSWNGKYLIVWKKEDGKWRIYADAWNRVE